MCIGCTARLMAGLISDRPSSYTFPCKMLQTLRHQCLVPCFYFQVGAWVSEQSEVLPNGRAELEIRCVVVCPGTWHFCFRWKCSWKRRFALEVACLGSHTAWPRHSHRQQELEAKYPEGTTVPKPPHWGGFLLRPLAIEFWQASTCYSALLQDAWAVILPSYAFTLLLLQFKSPAPTILNHG